MARGWESKSVEEQIGAAEAERDAQAERQTSPSNASKASGGNLCCCRGRRFSAA